MTIPERIIEEINFVASYVDDCDDWVTIKKEVMRGIPSEMRKNFSTRDPKTKEQWLNSFEKEVISYYYNMTGITLILRSLSERKDLDI